MEAAVASAKKPKLLDRVRSDLRVKRYSIRTEKAYIDWIRRFILFHGKRHPSEMGEQEISAFLTHLAVDRNVAASTQNQAFCALLFLYQQVLQRKLDFIDEVARVKRPAKIPVVFGTAKGCANASRFCPNVCAVRFIYTSRESRSFTFAMSRTGVVEFIFPLLCDANIRMLRVHGHGNMSSQRRRFQPTLAQTKSAAIMSARKIFRTP